MSEVTSSEIAVASAPGYWVTRQPKPENLTFVAGPNSGLTGRKGPLGKHGPMYYRGKRWLGPSNAVGHGKLTLVQVSPGSKEWGYAPVGGVS
jgi:hypothetical protein